MMGISGSRGIQICSWAIFLVVLTIPFSIGYNSAAIIVALAAALVWGDRHKMLLFFKQPMGIALSLYLVMIIVRCILERHFGMLERSMILMVLPFVFFIVDFPARVFGQVLRLYVLVVVAFALFTVFYTVMVYPLEEFSFYEFSGELARFRFFASNYIALYASFACILLFDSFFTGKLFDKRYGVPLFILLAVYLMILGSRTAFFMSIVIMITGIAVSVFKTRQWKTLVLAAVFLMMAVAPVAFVPYFKQRVVTLYTVGFESDARYYEFSAAVEVFKQAPWLGHGHAASGEAMVREFKRIGFHEGVERRFNAHNQYLQTLIDFGIVGLVLVCILLAVAVREAFRQRLFLPIAFVAFFLFCCLTEALLVRNRGIAFFALFSGVLLMKPDVLKDYYDKKVL